jgi:hypothetical protein
VLGRAFEIMLSDTFKGKDLGQFFTPREIVRFMLDLARDDENASVLNLENGERFLDACAGSGGFLIAVYEDVYRHIVSRTTDPESKKELLKRLGRETFFACEVEEKAARLGKLNMIIHAIDEDNSRCLHQNYHYNKEYGGLNPEITYEVDFGNGTEKHRIGQESFDLVMTNPPFGKAVKLSSILLNYKFGHEVMTFKTKGRSPEKRARKSQYSEILFLEHYIRGLKPGGKMLIILPDGLLSTKSNQEVREFIRSQTIIQAIISLPTETFMATSAEIPTSILYVSKRKPGEVQQPVFMAKVDNVGRKPNGDECDGSELPIVIGNYRQFRKAMHHLIDQSRLGILATLDPSDTLARLDVDFYWQTSDFATLSNESASTLNEVGFDYRKAMDEMSSLLMRTQGMLSTISPDWPTVNSRGVISKSLGELVEGVSRPLRVLDDQDYRILGVRWYGEGAYIKETKEGKKIKAEKMFQAEKGDLIVSRLFAWKGSLGLIDEALDGAVASNEFPMYRAKSEVEIEYIVEMLRTPAIWSVINNFCTGTSKKSRNRIDNSDFLSIRIPIILHSVQRRTIISAARNIKAFRESIGVVSRIASIFGFLCSTNIYQDLCKNELP